MVRVYFGIIHTGQKRFMNVSFYFLSPVAVYTPTVVSLSQRYAFHEPRKRHNFQTTGPERNFDHATRNLLYHGTRPCDKNLRRIPLLVLVFCVS